MSKSSTNEHTFYVINKSISPEDLMKWVKNKINRLSKKLKIGLRTEMYFNQVSNKQEKSLGFGYLWVMDPKVYYILDGKNPDGTMRVEIRMSDDNASLQEKIDEELEKLELTNGMLWADFEEKVDAIKDKHTPRIEEVILAPLIEFSELLEREAQFSIGPARVRELDSNYCENVLCADCIPEWATETQIKKSFEKFVSNPELTYTQNTKNFRETKVSETYPNVTLSTNRMAFVTFDRKGRDAQFALNMNTKVTIVHPKNHAISATLIFRHSYNRR